MNRAPSPRWEAEFHLLYETRGGGSWWPPDICRQATGKGCPEGAGAHLCGRPVGHRGRHLCPLCHSEWAALSAARETR